MLINAVSIAKSYSGKMLFQNLSFGINEKERVGLVGPNGAGKSTLLKILSKQLLPDAGEIVYNKGLRVGYLHQTPEFPAGISIFDAILGDHGHEESAEAYRWISQLELSQFDENKLVSELSGGWQKRVALAREMIKQPDVLLLDEPTNHLDIESILWLEEFIQQAKFATVTITHDRLFLTRVSNRILDLDPRFPGFLLDIQGGYIPYLEAKELQVHSQLNREAVMKNTLRRESEWLSRGAIARQTKQKARSERAGDIKQEVQTLRALNRQKKIEISFKGSESLPKKLVEAKKITLGYGDKILVKDFSAIIAPGDCVGLLGRNGIGKSTMIKALIGKLQPMQGSVVLADQIRLAYFEQNRDTLDFKKSVLKNICPDGDYVKYQGEYVFNRSYLEKFRFSKDQVDLPVGQLSGGEQARLRIAQLMLTDANLLVLDEPTNDLDVSTLLVLEEAIDNFPGAVILVSHDRYFLDQVTTQLWAFPEGDASVDISKAGHIQKFADYFQWEEWFNSQITMTTKDSNGGSRAAITPTSVFAQIDSVSVNSAKNKKAGLSFTEQHEFKNIENKIADLEAQLAAIHVEFEKPENLSQPKVCEELSIKMSQIQKQVDQTYERWQFLEAKAKV